MSNDFPFLICHFIVISEVQTIIFHVSAGIAVRDSTIPPARGVLARSWLGDDK